MLSVASNWCSYVCLLCQLWPPEGDSTLKSDEMKIFNLASRTVTGCGPVSTILSSNVSLSSLITQMNLRICIMWAKHQLILIWDFNTGLLYTRPQRHVKMQTPHYCTVLLYSCLWILVKIYTFIFLPFCTIEQTHIWNQENSLMLKKKRDIYTFNDKRLI